MTEPEWDETPVTISLVRQILEAHPDYTLVSQIGPDGNRYAMLQLFDEEPNEQANAEFVSFVSELESDSTENTDHD